MNADIRDILSHYLRNFHEMAALFGDDFVITRGLKCTITIQIGSYKYSPAVYYINRAFFDTNNGFILIYISKIYENGVLICDMNDAISYSQDAFVFRDYELVSRDGVNIYSKILCSVYSLIVSIDIFSVKYSLLNRNTRHNIPICKKYISTIYPLYTTAMEKYTQQFNRIKN